VSLIVRPEAAADIEAAHAWYENQRPGLGNEFLIALSTMFEVLVEHPRRHRCVHRDIHRANLRRFPYGIFFRIVQADVVVIACFHARRNPRAWQRRQ
jgi:plasmid stabilization system protein ParE